MTPAAFARTASKGKWILAKHLDLLNQELWQLATGQNHRLIVNMPPRHGKSEFVSKYFPAWYLGRYPEKKVILASYEASFAAQWGGKARDLLAEFGPDLFGVSVDPTSSATDYWKVAGHQGVMNTAGVAGPITGKGADILIIDDPVKGPEDAESQVLREKTWDWFDTVARTRLEPSGAIVLVMTRWHKDDLAGRLLNEGGWRHVCFPAIATDKDPLGRQEGEALWPDRFPLEMLLNERKAQMDAYNWSALYQQCPYEAGGNILKRQWWQFYDERPRLLQRIVQSWDTAFDKKTSSDYTVCGTWAEGDRGFYLLDVWRSRVEFPELKRAFVALFNEWLPYAVLIENKASGQSLIQEANRGSTIPVIAVEAIKSKEIRAHLVTPLLESGRVWLPANATWLRDYLDECEAFPSGVHDDQVDMTTQALIWLREHPVASALSIDTVCAKSRLPTGLKPRWDNED